MDYKVKNVYGKIRKDKVNVAVPGSKSITARALLLAALADGESVLHGVQFSDDCATFLNCLETLGINCSVRTDAVTVEGCGGRLERKSARLNVGSAGTAARFIPAFLAFCEGEYFLDCSDQMKARPAAPLISALKSVGAKFSFYGNNNSYPFTVRGASNPNTKVEVDISQSSQFLSALLISCVCAGKPFEITVKGDHGLDYVSMTVEMMKSFGGDVSVSDGTYRVCGGYAAREYFIEPDASAACYFYAMNKILSTRVRVNGLPARSLQGDVKFIELLENFDGGKIDMGGFSDQALTLAAIAPYLSRTTEICGVAHIRRQECDRIRAIAVNLNAMGVRCQERADGVIIYPSQPKPAVIETFGDHRVAMSFALTGLRADGIVIKNAEVCSKTFKNYFEVMDKLLIDLT